jgi:RNA polymerase sigma-70 factor (ECF subfamily)
VSQSTHDKNTQYLHDAILTEIPRLRRFSRYLMRTPDIADDLVQETLMRAVAAADSFQPGTNVRAWLFTILKNATRNHARRARRNPVDSIDTLDTTARSETLADPLQRLEFSELLAAIDLLPDSFKQVVLLCGVEGFRYEEASEIMGVPIGTIRSRLSRARRILWRRLEGKTVAPRAHFNVALIAVKPNFTLSGSAMTRRRMASESGSMAGPTAI